MKTDEPTAESGQADDAPPADEQGEIVVTGTRASLLGEAGAPFQMTDVMRPIPMRCPLQAHLIGDTWLVWFEQGGFAYWLGYATVARRQTSGHVAEVGGPTWRNPCAAARAWLAGDRTSALVRGPLLRQDVRPTPAIMRNKGTAGRVAEKRRTSQASPN